MRGRGDLATIHIREAHALLGTPIVPRGLLSAQEFKSLIHLARQYPQHAWNKDFHISQANNGHYTDTFKELEEALEKDFNFLEGDIRSRGDRPIIGHDENSFTLSVYEWLAIAQESGRGIKLDIKDPEAINQLLALTQTIPDHKLIFNVLRGDWDAGKSDASLEQIQRIRSMHPQAIINITPGSIPYTDKTLAHAVEGAQASGDPKLTMFPLQVEYITPDIIEKLKPYGMIGAWNIPLLYNPRDVQKDVARLRALGVDGMIDLRKYTKLPSIFPYKLSPSLANIALRLAKELEKIHRQ